MLLRGPMLALKPSRILWLAKGSVKGLQPVRQLRTHETHMSAALPKRVLGSTGYDVFPLGLGASPLGAAYGVSAPSWCFLRYTLYMQCPMMHERLNSFTHANSCCYT